MLTIERVVPPRAMRRALASRSEPARPSSSVARRMRVVPPLHAAHDLEAGARSTVRGSRRDAQDSSATIVRLRRGGAEQKDAGDAAGRPGAYGRRARRRDGGPAAFAIGYSDARRSVYLRPGIRRPPARARRLPEMRRRTRTQGARARVRGSTPVRGLAETAAPNRNRPWPQLSRAPARIETGGALGRTW